MRLLPSDPDIETLIGRIEKGDLDLQPDFQRGEVWSLGKRQRLIDSVLRDWHVPPVHVIQNDDQTVSVLDGQQRLAAIRDFARGQFSVDGELPPYDDRITRLDGLRFNDLPYEIQRRFLRFPIRLFTIVDYRPAEPGELFYRLNQLSSLTPAEQRNAFFGSTRKQVKGLAELVDALGLGEGLFGFSNARMAYDDVIARSLFLLDAGTLRKKMTSAALADRYRNDEPFSSQSIHSVELALNTMSLAQRVAAGEMRLNKATALTWIVFLAAASRSMPTAPTAENEHFLAEFMARFEFTRQSVFHDIYSNGMAGVRIEGDPIMQRNLFLRRALYEYEDRATSRVADITSVVLRDFVIWLFFLSGEISQRVIPSDHVKRELLGLISNGFTDVSLEQLVEQLEWGARI